MRLRLAKRAEMGVGTLIIFIAMLLVAAVAAGVLIQTAGSLQEKALSTGQQAKGQIATNVRVVEVSSTNGANGTLRMFETIMKLAPGSDPIKISQAILTFNTYDVTATLTYRGTNGTFDRGINTGFFTSAEEYPNVYGLTGTNLSGDLDEDGQLDVIYVNSSTDVMLNLSGSGTPINFIIPIADISDAQGTPVPISTGVITLTSGGVNYGTIEISGTTSTNDTIEAGMTTITPDNLGVGFFTVEYLQQGSNWVNGNVQRGDVIKIYVESPRNITEDEELRINFIPKIGTATLTQFVTPEVISTERVYLYP